ncbi:mucoidy inhibitor MuiA family protein, partial [bacterium]|nr:mucoidy inhibitor MuiA family protein [bacterium]
MRQFLATLLLLAAAAPAFALQTIERKAPITQVTIFNDRCEVTRSFSREYQPGDYQVKLTDLPAGLFDNSVRASGSGSARAKITGVKIETVYRDTVGTAGLKALQDSMTALEDQRASLDDRAALMHKEIDYLDRIKTASTDRWREESGDKQRAGQPQWTALYGFYDARHDAADKELRAIERTKRDLEKRRQALQHRVDRAARGERTTAKQVLVNLSVTEAGALDLGLNYVMLGASWHPLYDIRVSPQDKSVEFGYYGMIYQRTGEDWKDVRVVLSTAQPSVSGAAPAVRPWYLDVARVRYQKGMNEQQARMNVMNVQQKASPAPELTITGGFNADEGEAMSGVVDVETAAAEDLGTSYVFTSPGTSDIPSDGEPHKVSIAVETLAAEFEYAAVPRARESAYLKARVVNTTEYPFISGDINIFFGNNFVGTSAINTVVPSEKFNVSLGVD